jgi:hypothetical protein
MKAVKIIIGLAGGAYAAFQVRQLVQLLRAGNTSEYAKSGMLGCIAGILLGAALCIGLLQNALRKRAG